MIVYLFVGWWVSRIKQRITEKISIGPRVSQQNFLSYGHNRCYLPHLSLTLMLCLIGVYTVHNRPCYWVVLYAMDSILEIGRHNESHYSPHSCFGKSNITNLWFRTIPFCTFVCFGQMGVVLPKASSEVMRPRIRHPWRDNGVMEGWIERIKGGVVAQS